jgi:hypothetical protein
MVREAALALLAMQANPFADIPSSPGDDWAYVTSGNDGAYFFIRMQPTGRGRTDVRAWIMGRKRNTATGQSYASSMTLFRYDCSERTHQQLSYSLYSEAGARTLHEPRASATEYVIPGTVGEAWLNAACAN